MTNSPKLWKKTKRKSKGFAPEETETTVSFETSPPYLPTDVNEGAADGIVVVPRQNRKICADNETEYFRACTTLNLAMKMREGLAGVTKDRRWRSYKVYKNCFLHKDAIFWLMENDLEQEDGAEEQEKVGEKKQQSHVEDDDENEGDDSDENEEEQNTTAREIRKSMRHAGLEVVHAFDNVTDKMKPKGGGSSFVDSESRAVKLGNEMIDAGYVSHVCNEHRFKVGENHTLFFHFHNDVIESDKAELHRREIMERKMEEEIKVKDKVQFSSKKASFQADAPVCSKSYDDLELQISRMSHMLENVSTLLDDSKAKILVLETTIRSLTLLLGFLAYVTLSLVLFNMTSFGLEVSIEFTEKQIGGATMDDYTRQQVIMIKSFVLFVLAIGGALHTSFLIPKKDDGADVSFDQRVKEHMSILEHVATDDMEGKRGLLVEGIDQYVDDDSDISLGSKRSIADIEGPEMKSPAPVRLLKALSTKLNISSSKKSALNKSTLEPVCEGDEIKHLKRTVMREASDIPHPSEWPHRPVMVCVNTPVSSKLAAEKYGDDPLPIGVPFHFRSEIFEGMCLVRMKGVTSDDPDGDATYFMGRKRVFQYIVQGRFLEEIPVSEVLTGHEFVRPLKKLPPSWILRTGISLIERLAPGLCVKLNVEQPSALACLAATAQTVNGDMPGNEPDIRNNEIKEDLSILGGIFKTGNVSASKRKKHLMVPKSASKYTYDTESVYTFDFYQNLLDMKTYSLDLGFTKLGLAKNLDGQPIQIMSKTCDGRYLFSFQIWHEKLLPKKK